MKKYIGELLIIVGSGIFTYNVLSFSYTYKPASFGNPFLNLDNDLLPGIAYYYNTTSIVSITVAVMVVCVGYFIIKNKKV